MSASNDPAWPELSAPSTVFAGHHRYEVFKDFVSISMTAINNALLISEKLEMKYFQIINKDKKNEVQMTCELLGRLIVLLDKPITSLHILMR